MEDEKLGLQLQDLRIKKNITQEMVAEYMNVSRQTISKWEANKSKPSTKNLIRLAEFFEVPLSRLTGTVDHEKEINISKFNRSFMMLTTTIYSGSCILYSLGKGDALLQGICLFIIFVMGILMSFGIWKLKPEIRKKIAFEQLIFCIMCWLLNSILPLYIGNIITMLVALAISAFWVKRVVLKLQMTN